MKDLLIFIMATVGFTFIVTKSSLFKPLRERVTKLHKKYSGIKLLWGINELMNCNKCLGFWSGVVVFSLQYYRIDIALYGLSGCFVSWLIFDVISYLNRI